MLYDESWKLLESRFLKKGEEVRSGETIDFHGHLVEIGERKENHKTLPVMNAGGHSCSSFRKLEMPKQQDDISMGRPVLKGAQHEVEILATLSVRSHFMISPHN